MVPRNSSVNSSPAGEKNEHERDQEKMEKIFNRGRRPHDLVIVRHRLSKPLLIGGSDYCLVQCLCLIVTALGLVESCEVLHSA
jgi:hypothetical protein